MSGKKMKKKRNGRISGKGGENGTKTEQGPNRNYVN